MKHLNPGDYKSIDEWESAVIRNAEYFTVCKFLGRGQYERQEAPTLESARTIARSLTGRAIMIYAVYKTHSAYVESFDNGNLGNERGQ